jgi:predicted PurR-regulated permease PerM
MLVYQLIQLIFLILIGFFFGWETLLAFIAAATFGFLLLETVNYIEHYGLRRNKIDGAFYEKVMPITHGILIILLVAWFCLSLLATQTITTWHRASIKFCATLMKVLKCPQAIQV